MYSLEFCDCVVGIDLGGGEGGVAEQLFDAVEGGAFIEQLRGYRVPQNMGRFPSTYARDRTQFLFDGFVHELGIEAPSRGGEEQGRVLSVYVKSTSSDNFQI